MRVSREISFLEQFKVFYAAQSGVRLVIYGVLPGLGGLLVWATGRSGVEAWRMLFHALASLQPLLRERGVVALLFLVVLLAQLVAWLTLWGLFIWASGAILRYAWRQRHGPQTVHKQGIAWRRQQPFVDTDKVVVLQQLKVEGPALVGARQPGRETAAEGGAGDKRFSAQPLPRPQQEPLIWSFDTGPLQVLASPAKSPAPLTQLAAEQASPLHMQVGMASDPGIRHRMRPNEDNLIAMQGARTSSSHLLSFGLFAVADGIGGGTNGQEASNTALQAMLESVFPRLMSSNIMDDQVLLEVMTRGMNQANRVLYQRNLRDATRLGTTMTVALVIESKAYVVNVGDSRTYHYRLNKGLKQVTSDHSIVARLVDAGIISPEDAYSHPDRAGIYRSLGKEPRVEIDTFCLQMQAGDSLMLCSDGLWEMVRDPKIEQLLADNASSPMQITRRLLSAALEGGGEDNVSVVVARLE